MSICSHHFDKSFGQIDHIDRYPEMVPHVGTEYQAAGHKRLLLIGESNYLPPESKVHHDPQAWYAGTSGDLTDKEREWIHCRDLLASKTTRWVKGHTIYQNLEQALIAAGAARRTNMFSMVAYMNCFQRPAKEKLSLNVEQCDIDVSRRVMLAVTEIIRPEMICIVSSAAWRRVGSHLDHQRADWEFTPHPSSAWWNRRSRRGIGREVFTKFARKWLSR